MNIRFHSGGSGKTTILREMIMTQVDKEHECFLVWGIKPSTAPKSKLIPKTILPALAFQDKRRSTMIKKHRRRGMTIQVKMKKRSVQNFLQGPNFITESMDREYLQRSNDFELTVCWKSFQS